MSMPTLSTLSLCECVSMTDDGIALVAKNSPNLRCLNINKCQLLTGRCLRALAQVRERVWYLLGVGCGALM